MAIQKKFLYGTQTLNCFFYFIYYELELTVYLGKNIEIVNLNIHSLQIQQLFYFLKLFRAKAQVAEKN